MTTILILTVFTLLALVIGCAFLLPRRLVVHRTAIIDSEPNALITLASSSDGYQRFNPYLSSDPSLKIQSFGPANGVGSGFYFDGKEGKGSQTIARITPKSVHYDIDLGPMGRPEQILSFDTSSSGTEVSWKMLMDFGFNPIARIFGLFLDRMVGSKIELGLANLVTAVGHGRG